MNNLPFDKASLIAFIQSLPDDIQIGPFEMGSREPDVSFDVSPWGFAGGSNMLGGRHTREVENHFHFKLQFKTKQEGFFKRTYEEPEGRWSGIRRI